MTEADLLAAVAEASQGNPDAMTAREIRKATGMSERKLKDFLSEMSDSGRLVVHMVKRNDVSGRPQTVPAYTIAPKKRSR